MSEVATGTAVPLLATDSREMIPQADRLAVMNDCLGAGGIENSRNDTAMSLANMAGIHHQQPRDARAAEANDQ